MEGRKETFQGHGASNKGTTKRKRGKGRNRNTPHPPGISSKRKRDPNSIKRANIRGKLELRKGQQVAPLGAKSQKVRAGGAPAADHFKPDPAPGSRVPPAARLDHQVHPAAICWFPAEEPAASFWAEAAEVPVLVCAGAPLQAGVHFAGDAGAVGWVVVLTCC